MTRFDCVQILYILLQSHFEKSISQNIIYKQQKERKNIMINYIKVKGSLWLKGNKEERYMVRIYRGSNVSLDSIANQISHATTISYPDVLACFKALEIHVSNAVLNGQAVKFGFIPALRSKAVAPPMTLMSIRLKELPAVSGAEASLYKAVGRNGKTTGGEHCIR